VQDVEEPNSDEEKRSAIELDLLNVLPDELDPKVTYRQAVRLSSPPLYSLLARAKLTRCVDVAARDHDPARLHRRPRASLSLSLPLSLQVSLTRSTSRAQDSWHVINVDRYHNVRPDSRLMLSAFKAVAAEKDFQEKVRLVLFLLFLLEPLTRTRATLTHLGSSRSQLDNVRDRVDFIEALHRTVRPLSLSHSPSSSPRTTR